MPASTKVKKVAEAAGVSTQHLDRLAFEHVDGVTHLVAYYGKCKDHAAHRQVYPAVGVDAVKRGVRVAGDHASVHVAPGSFRPAVKS